MNLDALLSQLKERQLFKTTSFYLVASWLIVQVAATIFPVFDISDFWLKALIISLIIGLPIVVVGTYVQRGTDWSATHKKKAGIALYGLLFVMFVVGLGLAINRLGDGKDRIPTAVKNERIAVLFFENETGKEELDGIGSYLSLVITEGFRQLDNVKTVSPDMVRENMKYARVFPGNIENQISFTEATGAKYTINGRYFLEGDSIRIKAYLSDALNGESLFYFPDIVEAASKREALSAQLKNKILGYWANRDLIDQENLYVPNYDAYTIWAEANNNFALSVSDNIRSYKKSIALDSNFLAPYTGLAYTYDNTRQDDQRDSLMAVLWSKAEQMSNYEKLEVELLQAKIDRDHTKWEKYARQLLEKDPKNFASLATAIYPLNNQRKYQEAVAMLEEFDDSAVDYAIYFTWFIMREGSRAYLGAGQPEKALAFLKKRMPAQSNFGQLWQNRILALVRTNRLDELEATIAEVKKENFKMRRVDAYLRLQGMAAESFKREGNQALANEYADKALQVISKMESEKRAQAHLYFIKEDWDKAEQLYRALLARNPNNFNNLRRLGIILTKKVETDRSEVQSIIDLFESKDSPLFKGLREKRAERFRAFALGCIYAHLGDKEKAMEHLRVAMADEYFLALSVDYASLTPMFGYAPYEELVSGKY